MKLIDKAAAVGEVLAKETDALRGKIALAEARLAATKLGVSAAVPLYDHTNVLIGELVWSKVGAAWAFRWRTTGGEVVDLLRAPKEIRTRGALAMTELVAALSREGERQLVEMEKANDVLDAWMKTFEATT